MDIYSNSDNSDNNFASWWFKVKKEEILFWIFIAIALLLLILRLKGSPSFEAIIAALVGAIGLLWKDFSDFKGEVREFMGKVKQKLKIK